MLIHSLQLLYQPINLHPILKKAITLMHLRIVLKFVLFCLFLWKLIKNVWAEILQRLLATGFDHIPFGTPLMYVAYESHISMT